MKTSKISSIAHALPATTLTYEELERRFGAKEVATAFRMTGIRNRRVVAPGQSTLDLAYAAARRLLAEKNIAPDSIDEVIVATQTPDHRIPAVAPILHGKLGLRESCQAFDVSQACSSFLSALSVAHSAIVSGIAKRVLMVSADALTTVIHPLDRGLVVLHGDAAAAALVEPSEGPEGVEFMEFGTDGSKYDKLIVPAGGSRQPSSPDSRVEVTDEAGCVRTAEHLLMDGPTVFHFCVYKVTAFLKKLLTDRGLSVADYDRVLLHQANKTMVDLVYKSIGAPPEKRFYYLEDVGNSSGASLPCALAEAWRSGAVKPGMRTLLCSFGGGLSWGAASIKWGQEAAGVPGSVDVAHVPAGCAP
jgi:3-oxoacyl-[acyl-carrier-protein] synthase-3